jgi:capsular polysaccharide transport system permease protein
LPILVFAITGYSSVLVWRNTVGRCIGGIPSNVNLFYHRNVRVLDVMATRVLLELAGATASFIVLTVVFLATEWIEPPRDVSLVLFGWGMLS